MACLKLIAFLFCIIILLGAMLTLKVDERIFTKTSLDRLVSSLMVEDGSPGSQSYSYRTGNDVIQLLIVDNTTNQRSVRLASKTFDYLKKGICTTKYIYI